MDVEAKNGPMRTTSDRSPSLLRHLATPFVLVVCLAVIVVGGFIVYTARSQNELATAASIHLAGSVLAEIQHRTERVALDFSYWDQAADHLVNSVDTEWADENVGTYINTAHAIPAIYVLNGDNRLVYSMLDSDHRGANPRLRFPEALDALIDRTRAAPKDMPPQPAIGLARDSSGVYVVAASVITDYHLVGGKTVDRSTMSVLVLSRPLDESFLAEPAEAFSLDGLRLSPSLRPAPYASLPLTDAAGAGLGYLSWQVRLPGNEMVVRILPAIGAAFFLVALFAVLFFRRTLPVVSAQARDLETRRQIETALLKSQSRLQEFAADAAHELRTPLAVMRASLDNHGDQDVAEPLRKDVDSMARLVEQLLAEARLDSLEIEPTDETNLRAVCADVATQLAPLAVRQNKNIELAGAKVPVIVRVDAEALHHAVRNLVENAIRFTESGTVVTITVRDDASVSVVDQGPGVPRDMRDKVFERFERLDRKTGGAGLGLSIVRRTVEAHEGAVRVVDGPEGRAEFVLQFPPTSAGSPRAHATS